MSQQSEQQPIVSFKPRISLRRASRFWLGLGLGMLAGLATMYFRWYTGLVITGFLGGVFIYLLAQSFALGSRFGLQARGILAQRFYRQRWFPAREIDQLGLMTEAQVNTLLADYQTPQSRAGLGLFKAGQRLSQFIEYCTVTLVMTEGKRAQPVSARRRSPEDDTFVLLTLKSGKQYLLSPQRPADFINQYHRIVRSRSKSI